MRKILDTAAKIFLEKGYDNTSIQDIVNALGMSKGAIYHHFKSKEELYTGVINDYYSRGQWFENIINDPSKNGLQKLKAMFCHEISDETKISIDQLYFARLCDPKMILENMRRDMQETAPMLSKIIEEGNRDGSLAVEHPLECAELALFMVNIWIGVFTSSKEKFLTQMEIFGKLTRELGADFVDDEIMRISTEYYDRALIWAESQKDTEGLWGLMPLI